MREKRVSGRLGGRDDERDERIFLKVRTLQTTLFLCTQSPRRINLGAEWAYGTCPSCIVEVCLGVRCRFEELKIPFNREISRSRGRRSYPKTQNRENMAEEGKADEQLFQLLSNLLQQVRCFLFSFLRSFLLLCDNMIFVSFDSVLYGA